MAHEPRTNIRCDTIVVTMFTETDVRNVLRQVVDPELGVNIVDLGLVYGIQVEEERVRLALTMTTPACPLLDYMKTVIEEELRAELPGIRGVAIDVVWEPPWGPEMMTDAARAQLNGGR